MWIGFIVESTSELIWSIRVFPASHSSTPFSTILSISHLELLAIVSAFKVFRFRFMKFRQITLNRHLICRNTTKNFNLSIKVPRLRLSWMSWEITQNLNLLSAYLRKKISTNRFNDETVSSDISSLQILSSNRLLHNTRSIRSSRARVSRIQQIFLSLSSLLILSASTTALSLVRNIATLNSKSRSLLWSQKTTQHILNFSRTQPRESIFSDLNSSLI